MSFGVGGLDRELVVVVEHDGFAGTLVLTNFDSSQTHQVPPLAMTVAA